MMQFWWAKIDGGDMTVVSMRIGDGEAQCIGSAYPVPVHSVKLIKKILPPKETV